MTNDPEKQESIAEKRKVNPKNKDERTVLIENIKRKSVYYGIPAIFAIVFFYSFFNYSAPDLNNALNGIYSIYITVSTIILSVSFVVISILPIYFEGEEKNIKFYIGPMMNTHARYPINSLYLLSSNHRVLVLSLMVILTSLISYILTASHIISDFHLKLLLLFTTFFVISSVFALALLTGELHKNLIRNVFSERLYHP